MDDLEGVNVWIGSGRGAIEAFAFGAFDAKNGGASEKLGLIFGNFSSLIDGTVDSEAVSLLVWDITMMPTNTPANSKAAQMITTGFHLFQSFLKRLLEASESAEISWDSAVPSCIMNSVALTVSLLF